ncbi:MAG TPA: hypothetical protein VGA03_06675 [Anaerolineales bacterium]
MDDRLLRILPHLEVTFSIPEDIPPEIAAAAEVVVIVVAYGFLQAGIAVTRAVAGLQGNEIAIRFASQSVEYIREYLFPVQGLLDSVQAWQRHYPAAGQGFEMRQRAIAEIAAAFRQSCTG